MKSRLGVSLSKLTTVVILVLGIWCNIREIRGFELVYGFLVPHHERFSRLFFFFKQVSQEW